MIDLVAEVVHVTRGGTTSQLRAGDSLAPMAFPDLVLEVQPSFPDARYAPKEPLTLVL